MLSFGIEAGSVNDRPGSLSTYRFPAVSGRPETSGTPLTRTFPVLNQPNIGWDALTTTVGLHAVGAVGLDTLLGFRCWASAVVSKLKCPVFLAREMSGLS